jgi:hypothetical protein
MADPAMAAFAVDRPIWSEPVPRGGRVSREALIDIADSYFEGITQARAGITPFDDGCVRFENGGQMTLAEEGAFGLVQQMSCEEQFATGMLIIVTSISNRGYLVIDEESQVASAIASSLSVSGAWARCTGRPIRNSAAILATGSVLRAC